MTQKASAAATGTAGISCSPLLRTEQHPKGSADQISDADQKEC